MKANVSKLFAVIAPRYVSASNYELGQHAGEVTWRNALTLAERPDHWLLTPLEKSAEECREWARDTGAWDQKEISAWGDLEALAIGVQLIASDVREKLLDDWEYAECGAESSTDRCWFERTPEGIVCDMYLGV